MIHVTRDVNALDVVTDEHRTQDEGTAGDQRGEHAESAKLTELRRDISAALDSQSEALLAGDLQGFVSPADTGAAALREELTRRFVTLRALRVASWSEALAGELGIGENGAITAPVEVSYCFVVSSCVPVSVTVRTQWEAGAHQVRLTVFGASSSAQTGPRPWETSALRALVGNRVIVAGPEELSGRLRGVLAAAERAAAVADTYARWEGTRPDRYVVYVAGPEEWQTWYGVAQAGWVAAYAMPLSATYTEIVVNSAKVGKADIRDVLQHEFSHVVTLAGVERAYPNTWWLIEGIAEYVQNRGLPVSSYRALADGRTYLRDGLWDGQIALGEPSALATATEANGRYAVAFLSVRRLASRYGEEATLAFFAAVVRDGQETESACREAFGHTWTQVSDECARYVRRILQR